MRAFSVISERTTASFHSPSYVQLLVHSRQNATVASIALLVAGGAAFGAYRYERARAAMILPGVEVAGVDVGGMTKRQATQAVRAVVDDELSRPLTVEVAGERVKVAPADLGRRAAVGEAIAEALALNATYSTLDRFWHRVNDEPVDAAIDLRYATAGRSIEQLAAALADEACDFRVCGAAGDVPAAGSARAARSRRRWGTRIARRCGTARFRIDST